LGGLIALVEDGDLITIDATTRSITVHIGEEEIARRRAKWVAPPLKVSSGVLYKYARFVSTASEGCVTDL
jgi:dihydroxy-acid dehydratase